MLDIAVIAATLRGMFYNYVVAYSCTRCNVQWAFSFMYNNALTYNYVDISLELFPCFYQVLQLPLGGRDKEFIYISEEMC